MRVPCLISSSVVILLSALLRFMACSPSLVIISNEIVVSTKRPAFHHFSSANPYTTKAPFRLQTSTSSTRANWPRTGAYNQPTPESTKQDRSRSTSVVQRQIESTPSWNSRSQDISTRQDDALAREKRLARGGTFGNTGRHGPRDRLDYNSSHNLSITCHILFTSILLTCGFFFTQL